MALNHRSPRLRAMLMAMAAVGLVAGVWSGLVRAGWVLPVGGPVSPISHGVLMVSGFFGALISLERAVALDRWWGYVAPPAAAFGALGAAAGFPGAEWSMVLAAGVAVVGSVVVWRTQSELFVAVMAGGAASWLIAATLPLLHVGLDAQVPWLAGFLVLTIVGERLELSRLAPPSPWKQPTFAAAATMFIVGVAWSSWGGGAGWRVFGGGLLLLAVWLGVWDVARRTVRLHGVTSFIAWCLLSGYVWMAVAGSWWLAGGDLLGSLGWDGALHALFVGFVLAMVFGHVHMVAPALLGVAVPFRRVFVGHLVLLHVSLGLRVVGDLVGDAALRRWGALGNAAALGMFLVATVWSATSARRSSPRVNAVEIEEVRV